MVISGATWRVCLGVAADRSSRATSPLGSERACGLVHTAPQPRSVTTLSWMWKAGGIETITPEQASALHDQQHYQREKDAVVVRMRRLEEQARDIQRMIEDGKYCPDIVQKPSALISAAREV